MGERSEVLCTQLEGDEKISGSFLAGLRCFAVSFARVGVHVRSRCVALHFVSLVSGSHPLAVWCALRATPSPLASARVWCTLRVAPSELASARSLRVCFALTRTDPGRLPYCPCGQLRLASRAKHPLRACGGLRPTPTHSHPLVCGAHFVLHQRARSARPFVYVYVCVLRLLPSVRVPCPPPSPTLSCV